MFVLTRHGSLQCLQLLVMLKGQLLQLGCPPLDHSFTIYGEVRVCLYKTANRNTVFQK